MQNKEYIEEEIDLKELLSIIIKKKKFIFIFTILVTFLALVYVSIKSPIYEVKSVVRIGYIGTSLVEASNVLETKLRIVFGVGSNLSTSKDEGIVSNISLVKKVDDFLEITTQGYSNEKALEKNRQVVEFLQNEYKYKIDEYILNTNLGIKNLENKIKYLNEVERENIKLAINKIKLQTIPRIDNQISFINSVEIKSIDNKLEFNQLKLKEYENDVIKIVKQKSPDNTQNMFMSVQILNAQNLILNLQSQIDNLKKERVSLVDIKLKDLEQEKQNLLNENIRKLEVSLNIDLEKDIEDLKDKIELEKLKITNNIAKNSEIVGEVWINKDPIKPKKTLVVLVTFISSIILTMFLVFVMYVINNSKKGENIEK